MPAKQAKASLGYAPVRFIVCREVLGAVNRIDSETAKSAAKLAETRAIRIVVAAEIEKGVLHLNPLDVTDSTRGDIHVSAGVHSVPHRSGPKTTSVDIVDAHRCPDSFPVSAGGNIPRSTFIPNAVRACIDIVVAPGRK